MGTEVRFLRAGEYPLARDFLDEHWARGHIYVREPELFEWTFNRELWPHDSYSFAIASDAGRTIGILGAIPFRFNGYGEPSLAIWLANWMMHPDYRHTPTGIQLLGLFRRQRFSNIISFGINPEVARIYRALRWPVLNDIPRFFGVLPGAVDRVAALVRAAHPSWDDARAIALAQHFATTPPHPRPPEGEVMRAIPEDWDRQGWGPVSGGLVGAARDAEFLSWRYRDHPIFTYHIIALRSGERWGLAVWRLEQIRHQRDTSPQPPERLARLVEFLPTGEENARALAGTLIEDVSRAGALGIDYYGYHGPTGTLLDRTGIRDVSTHPDGGAIPSRFQPLEERGGAIMSAVQNPWARPPGPSLDPDCPWYWTKSDSDQDRPN